MTLDLYEILGVKRDATFDDILAGWRAQCRRYHPDMPHGDADRFRQIQHAYSVLKNTKRRENYDRTGETTERPEGADDSEAFNYLTNLIQEAVGNIHDEKTQSLVNTMHKLLEKQITHVGGLKRPHVAQKDKLEKILARLKVKKDKKPVLQMLIGAQLAAIQIKITAFEHQEKTIARVREIVDDHTYTTENAPKSQDEDLYLPSSLWR